VTASPRAWYALEVTVPEPAAEVVAARLWNHALTGLEEDPDRPGRMTAYAAGPWDEARMAAAIAAWVARVPGADPSAVRVRAYRVVEEDWLRIWKESWRPTPLGARLLAVPAWWEGALPADRAPVWIDPGRAFGTGTHASTALAWELLEACLDDPAPRRFLDVGAGSGILSLGAAALVEGLRAVLTEADRDALGSLRGNLARNASGERCRATLTRSLPFVPAAFDLAAANLTASEYEPLEDGLARCVAPGGRIVQAGLRDEQAPAAEARWRKRGWAVERRREREGWTAFTWRR
jgi:ribosomal protein L11 methyltransferase